MSRCSLPPAAGASSLSAYRRAARGQAGIEFALVAPLLVLLIVLGVQLLGYAYARSQVGNLADHTALDAGMAGGETNGVDARLARDCAVARLLCGQLLVRLSTTDADGTILSGAWHAATSAASSDWPPPAAQGSDVIVELQYTYTLGIGGMSHPILIRAVQVGTALSARIAGPAQ